jgi:glutathione S-transferase
MCFPSLRFPLMRSWSHTRSRGSQWRFRAERELSQGKNYLLGPEPTLADCHLLPCTYSFSFAPETKTMHPKFPAFCRWRERMEGPPAVEKLRATLPPRAPIEHAREWAISHRPKY